MSPSTFKFQLFESLPKLAWCAILSKDDPVVVVQHGSGVETSGKVFFEGAWDGDFVSADFLDSITCAGSGGLSGPSSVQFCSPTHTLERLFSVRADDRLYVSNSLVYVLAAADDDVDVNYPFYHHDFASVIDGIDKYVRGVPTLNGAKLEQYYHCNFEVLRDLTVKVRAKTGRAAFGNYSDYEDFLRSSVLRLCANAADSRRRRLYTPLATVSSGYDSPAAAALAAAAGCNEALTFAVAREEFEDSDDSGEAIGKKLGMSVRIYDRTAYRGAEDLPEAEFLATGMGGEDVVMAPFEDALDGKVLFTGFHGDKVWHYGNQKVSATIVRGDASGGSLGEFRLRVGFIHLPIPFIGCLQHPSINKITMSAEMEQWFVQRDTKAGQIYNRPIPRRLAEEAGIPREWFGQRKRAVTQPLAFVPLESWLSNLPLANILSSASNRDFRSYLDSNRSAISTSHFKFATMHLLYRVNQSIAWRVARLSKGKYRDPQKLMRLHWRYQYPLTEHLWGFHWGVQRTRHRYQRPEAIE